jgi:hypothetical protein
MGEYQADPVENHDLNAYSSPGKVDEKNAGAKL